MRAFIAVPLDRPAQMQISDTLRGLGGRAGVRKVSAQDLHITLWFLGQIDARQVDAAAAAMLAATRGIGPFELQIGPGLASLGTRRRVIAAHVSGQLGELQGVYHKLRAGLRGPDWAPDIRPFRPHLTLARLPRNCPADKRRCIWQEFERAMEPAALRFQVSTVVLFASLLRPEGATYKIVRSQNLVPSADNPCPGVAFP